MSLLWITFNFFLYEVTYSLFQHHKNTQWYWRFFFLVCVLIWPQRPQLVERGNIPGSGPLPLQLCNCGPNRWARDGWVNTHAHQHAHTHTMSPNYVHVHTHSNGIHFDLPAQSALIRPLALWPYWFYSWEYLLSVASLEQSKKNKAQF